MRTRITQLSQSPLLRLLSSAVFGQALLSAGSFAVGLMLIRNSSDADYGHFVLMQTALALLVSLQGACITGPLTLIAARQGPSERRDWVAAADRERRRYTLALVLVGLLLAPLLFAAQLLSEESSLVLGAAVIASWAGLEREYLRSALLIYTRATAVLLADIIYIGVLLGLVALAIQLPTLVAVWAILALAIAAWAGAWLARRSLARDPGFSTAPVPGLWAQFKPIALWAMAGVVIYWSFSQGYNYLLALRLDVQAVAAVAATRLLLMPVNLLTTGVKGLLVPLASRWLPELGVAGLARRLLLLGLALALFAGVYCLLLWLFRDWVMVTVLNKQIAQYEALLLAWTGLFLLALVRECLQCLLYIQERFKSLTLVAAGNAVFSLPAIWWLMDSHGALGAVLGLAVGDVLFALSVFLLVGVELKKARRPVAPSPQP